MKRTLRKITRILGGAKGYQERRDAGTQQRWVWISQYLGAARSLLDVGCADGSLTAAAAQSGLFALGVEANPLALRLARKRIRPGLSVCYMEYRVTPQNIEALPICDVVLCTSVYHVWHRDFGHAGAQAMLRMLGEKARRYLFFEPASRQKKYGTSPPPFQDCNESSITSYATEMLNALFPGTDRVRYLGASACLGKEPNRYLFVVQM